MSKETLMAIGIILSLAGVIFVLYRYKREYLKVVCYYAVIEAEELYKSKEGQEKLLFATNKVKSKLPWYLSWLISINAIKSMIESVLETLQATFKSSKEKQLAIIDNLRTYGVSDVRLNTLQSEINKNGYVEGYAEVKTDLRGNNHVAAGVRAGAKF